MSRTPRRTLTRVAVGLAAAGALVLALPLAAAAHVGVSATSTAAGGYTRLTFSVPTESDSESTVRVEVELPSDTPFTSVRSVRVPGWTAELVTSTLPAPVEGPHGTRIEEAVTRVVWTADTAADAIRPDETGLFELAVGPLPAVEEVYFPALQVYDSGREVYWSQQASGSAEPDHPAPSLGLTAAESGDVDATTVDASDGIGPAGGGDPASPWAVATTVASVAALLVALAALLIAVRRRPTPPA